jgi:NhaP-type Na+/H+ or K+/H+ antiporter
MSAAVETIGIVVTIVGVGVGAQVLADRLRVPSVVFLVLAGVLWYVLSYGRQAIENAPQNARLMVFAASLVMYGIAEVLGAELGASEAGIAAVATGGFLLGNTDLPYRGTVAQFKGDISVLVIAFVFVTLASLLSIDDLLGLGLGGLVTVVAIAAVVRPLAVFLSTVSDRLTLRERVFISGLGPRGIIPASVATLFALELQATNPTAATTLVGTVFLVIVVTVVFEAGLARHITQALDVIPMRAIIVGGGRVGKELASRLEEHGEDAVIVERDAAAVEELRKAGYAVRKGDGTQQDVLERAGIENASIVAVATKDDDANLLVGQLARNTYGSRRSSRG